MGSEVLSFLARLLLCFSDWIGRDLPEGGTGCDSAGDYVPVASGVADGCTVCSHG